MLVYQRVTMVDVIGRHFVGMKSGVREHVMFYDMFQMFFFFLGKWGKKILVMMDGTRQRRVVGSFDVASLICNGLGGLVPRLSQVR